MPADRLPEFIAALLLVTSFTVIGWLALWAAFSTAHWFVRTLVILTCLSPLLAAAAYEAFVAFALQCVPDRARHPIRAMVDDSKATQGRSSDGRQYRESPPTFLAVLDHDAITNHGTGGRRLVGRTSIAQAQLDRLDQCLLHRRSRRDVRNGRRIAERLQKELVAIDGNRRLLLARRRSGLVRLVSALAYKQFFQLAARSRRQYGGDGVRRPETPDRRVVFHSRRDRSAHRIVCLAPNPSVPRTEEIDGRSIPSWIRPNRRSGFESLASHSPR